jgi:predicted acetyltransferase
VEIPELTMRALTADDASAYSGLLSRAFLHDSSLARMEQMRSGIAELAPGRVLGVFDGDRLVGGGIMLARSITLPGGQVVPFGGVSGIAVASDHRRRGVLTWIMRAQLHDLHEQGAEPFAALWASESRIYPHFGYGEASQAMPFELPKGSEFRPGIELSKEPIRELPQDRALPLLEAIYAKALPNRVGRLGRTPSDWADVLFDEPNERGGATERRFAVHPEGYAVYRVRSGRDERGQAGRLIVQEVVSTTPHAHASLWRYLLDMDLVGEISGWFGSDDPLRQMLAEPQDGGWRRWPGLWVRIVDVDRALAARRYSTALDVVFEVTDEFCPWNAGGWRLRVDGSGVAEVTRTEDAADIAIDIVDLGAIFLGGTRLSTLALTGRVRELTDGAVARATLAFLGEHEPETTEIF